MSRGDRIVGVLLGLILGVAIVAVFVFVFSNDAVDSASLDRGSNSSKPAAISKPAAKKSSGLPGEGR